MQADKKTHAEVKALWEQWLQTYCKKDAANLLRLCTNDPDLTLIGTTDADICVGPDGVRTGLERDFCEFDSAELATDGLRISASGNVAWLSGQCGGLVRAEGEKLKFEGRVTAVFERRGGNWFVAQVHVSSPAASTGEP